MTDISNSFLLASCPCLPSSPKEKESFGEIFSTNFIYVKSSLEKKKKGEREEKEEEEEEALFLPFSYFKDGGGEVR